MVDAFVPRPVPSAYLLLRDEERDWRGRVCVALLESGFDLGAAWRFALSRDEQWSDFAHRELAGFTDVQMEVLAARRRLSDLVGEAQAA